MATASANKKLALALVVVVALAASGAVCQNPYPGCSGTTNTKPVLYGNATLQATVTNGARYFWQNSTDNSSYVYIVQVSGSPYEMGFAFGRLMASEVRENLDSMIQYVQTDLADAIFEVVKVPLFLQNMISTIAMDTFRGLIHINWLIAQPYTPERFSEELRGIADGSGASFYTLVEANMLPEITRAHCTIVGAWDEATPGGAMYQLRALDWNPRAPVNKYPAITVYHPTFGGNVFANIGYAGFIGALTAYSQKQIAISQKVWIPKPANSSIQWTYVGTPWAFALRDVAQFADDLQQAVDMLYNTKRTIMNMYGIGSGASRKFEGIEYAANVLYTFTDKNYTYYSDAHPQLDGVFFWDKHPQPSTDPCVGNILKGNWPSITAETLYRQVTGQSRTGNAQICVFDVYNDQIYLSYSQYGTTVDAFDRSVMFIDLKPFWNFPASGEGVN